MRSRRRFLLLVACLALAAGALLERAGRSPRDPRPSPRGPVADPDADVSRPAPGGGRFEVEVRSGATGLALPGARLSLEGFDGERYLPLASAVTGEDGRAALPDLRGTLRVSAPGHLGAIVESGDASGRRLLTLEPLGAIEVVVRDLGGSPREAAVELVLPVAAGPSLLRMAEEDRPPDPTLRGRTDAAGVLLAGGLPPAEGYLVRAGAEGCSLAEASVAVVAGRTTRVELRLLPAAALVGRVVSSAGRPLDGAEVRLFHRIGSDWEQTGLLLSGASGEFRFETPKAGAAFVQAEHRTEGAVAFAGASVTVEPGRTTDAGELRVAEGTLLLRVLAPPTAAPAAAAEVKIVLFVAGGRRPGGIPFASTSLRSRAGGAVRYEGLPPGRLQILVSPDEPSFAPARVERPHRGGGVEEIEIVLEPRREPVLLGVALPGIAGRRSVFLVSEGRPVAGFRDIEGSLTPLRFRPPPESSSGEVWTLEADRFARTPYAISGSSGRVEVLPGHFVPAAAIGGRVRAAATTVLIGLPGARDAGHGAIAEATPDAAGRFRAGGLPPETLLEIAVRAGDRLGPARIFRTPGPGDVDETMELDPP
jgi:hypothetical protein